MNAKCECSIKSTKRDASEQKKLINRLNRIEGQIRGIKKMILNDAYCVDILTQSSAANAAINSFNKSLIANHIKNCVVRDIQDEKFQTVDELLEVLQKLMK